jgi:FKBP-type peptidyl-prolyl cis-trans isomerase FkpA
MRLNNIYIILLVIIVFASCKNTKEKTTPSGMKYIVHREMNGKKPHAGDWVTIQMVYKQYNDSVLFDSRTLGKPLRFELPQSKFEGSFEEGLTLIGEGDSASFFIDADSMFTHVISQQKGVMVNRPKPGTKLRFDVSLLRVQSYKEAEMEIAMDESNQEQAERKTLEAYLVEKNIHAEKKPEGYYIEMQSPGKGALIKNGEKVSVFYTGRFLNGVIFDSNANSGKPYIFTVGNNEVIKGWDLAVQQLRKGDKVTLIIPSTLGYGKDGVKRGNSAKYFIPPYSTLIFDFEVASSASPLSPKGGS